MKNFLRFLLPVLAVMLLLVPQAKACDIFSSCIGGQAVFASNGYAFPVQSVAVNASYASPTYVNNFASYGYANSVAVVNATPSYARSFNVVAANPVIRFQQFVPTAVAVRNVAVVNKFHGANVVAVKNFGHRNNVVAVNAFGHRNNVVAVNSFGNRVFVNGGHRNNIVAVNAFGHRNNVVSVRRGLFGGTVVRVR